MRNTRALIHLANLRHNLSVVAARCPDSKLCLAVKADAYGHGAVAVAKAALGCGVYALGTAIADEALELRRAGVAAPVLLYGIAAPDELEDLVKAKVELFCADEEQLDAIRAQAERLGLQAVVHIKVDTGMGRIGCRPDQALPLARRAAQRPDLVRIAGVCTHFPLSEDSDTSYTAAQIERFRKAVAEIRAAGIDAGLAHAANSGGIALHPAARLDMVRPGIVAYGYPPDDALELGLRPVMELRSAVSFIKRVPAGTPLSYGHRYRTERDCWIGTVALGYADGLHRAASGKLRFLAADGSGRSFPQVGTVCMDQCLVELGPADRPAPLKRWDELVVFGPQPGAESAAGLAKAAGTISYEITCGISKRVPRVYLD